MALDKTHDLRDVPFDVRLLNVASGDTVILSKWAYYNHIRDNIESYFKRLGVEVKWSETVTMS